MGIIKKAETNGIFVKIRSKTTPSLFISTKNENGDWIDEDISAIEGTVAGIFFTSRVSAETKEEIETVNIRLQDGEEQYILQSAWTFPMRSIVNSILGAGDQLGKVRIGVYGKISGDKTFPAVSFKNNDQRVNRLLDIDEQKDLVIPVVHPKTNKIEKYDYSDLNGFFREKLVELNTRLNPKEVEVKEIDFEPKASESTTISSIADDVDDLPF